MERVQALMRNHSKQMPNYTLVLKVYVLLLGPKSTKKLKSSRVSVPFSFLVARPRKTNSDWTITY
jgi:hypothetical protein